MYEEVGSKLDLPQLERRIAQYWRQAGIFEKSVARSTSEVIFYDGPPFPTGSPHPGTVFVSILKDALARFFTMRGNSVPRAGRRLRRVVGAVRAPGRQVG